MLHFVCALVVALASDQVDKAYVRGQWKHPGEMMFRISGRVLVEDAHTIKYVDGTEVDLNGLQESPDLSQQGSIEGHLYPLGMLACEHLKKVIGSRPVTCYADGQHVTGSKVRIAIAFVGETELNEEMVRSGWAVSDHSAMDPWEIIARDHRRGMWRGQFVLPRKWRDGERLPGEPPKASIPPPPRSSRLGRSASARIANRTR